MKRIYFLFALIIIFLCVTGCSSITNNSDVTTSNPNNNNQINNKWTVEEYSVKKVELIKAIAQGTYIMTEVSGKVIQNPGAHNRTLDDYFKKQRVITKQVEQLANDIYDNAPIDNENEAEELKKLSDSFGYLGANLYILDRVVEDDEAQEIAKQQVMSTITKITHGLEKYKDVKLNN